MQVPPSSNNSSIYTDSQTNQTRSNKKPRGIVSFLQFNAATETAKTEARYNLAQTEKKLQQLRQSNKNSSQTTCKKNQADKKAHELSQIIDHHRQNLKDLDRQEEFEKRRTHQESLSPTNFALNPDAEYEVKDWVLDEF